MKQGWSCPSWHRSREQTQSGGRVGSSAKPSRGGRTCYRCLGWCGMWAEGSAHCTRVLLSFYSTEVIYSSLWPDLIRRVGFLSSVFFFFFFSYGVLNLPLPKYQNPWLVFSTWVWILFPLDTHCTSALGFVWNGSFKGRALSLSALNSLWMSLWAFPSVISAKVNHKVKECALAPDTMPDKYFQQATAKETQVWSRS